MTSVGIQDGQTGRSLFNGEEHGPDLAKAPAFTRPIHELAAGAKFVYVLGAGHRVLLSNDTRCPKAFTVKAAYKFGPERTPQTASSTCIRWSMHPQYRTPSPTNSRRSSSS